MRLEVEIEFHFGKSGCLVLAVEFGACLPFR